MNWLNANLGLVRWIVGIAIVALVIYILFSYVRERQRKTARDLSAPSTEPPSPPTQP